MLWVIITVVVASFSAGILSAFTCETFEKRSVGFRTFFASVSTLVAVLLTCKVCYEKSFEEGAITREGISIPVALRPDLVGKVIRPISVVNDGGSTMLVGKDLKLYSLLGVQLESGLSTTDMVGKELIVYKKGEVTCIGVNNKPGITDIPTQIGYTNK